MSRRHSAVKREVLPDAKYGNTVLTKFMNNLMLDGRKSAAERTAKNQTLQVTALGIMPAETRRMYTCLYNHT